MEKTLKVYAGAVKEFDETERTITAYASTIDKDRQGDIIPIEAWNLSNYNKNPVILWAHDYSAPPVGKALWTKTDKRGLLQKIKFASTDFATDIFNLMKDGFLNAFSVGFMGERREDDPGLFKSAELLEVSVVPVPANAGALAERAAKGFKSQLAGMIIKGMLAEAGIKKEDEKLVDETEESIRVRIRPPSDFVEDSFRTIDIDAEKGIKSVVGKLKSDPEGGMKIQNYIFDKAKGWTKEEAVKWAEDHKEDACKPEDEKDDEDKSTQDAASKNWTTHKKLLIEEIARLKSGRVLSSKNKTLIEGCVETMKDAVAKLEELLAAAGREEEEEDKEDKAQLDNAEKSIIIKTDPKAKEISAEDFKAISQDIKAGIAEALSSEIKRLKGIV